MKSKIALLFVMALLALNLSSARAEDTKAPAAPFTAEEMAKWQAYATPNENHKVLEQAAGEWSYTCKMWMEKDAPAQETKGNNTNKMILGGRFLQAESKGDFQGQPFEGIAITGYDNQKKEYNSIWIDSMGTGMAISKAKYDPATQTLTEKGSFSCPLNDEVKFRSEWKFIDANHYTYSMYGKGKNNKGDEFKTMEIDYTRK